MSDRLTGAPRIASNQSCISEAYAFAIPLHSHRLRQTPYPAGQYRVVLTVLSASKNLAIPLHDSPSSFQCDIPPHGRQPRRNTSRQQYSLPHAAFPTSNLEPQHQARNETADPTISVRKALDVLQRRCFRKHKAEDGIRTRLVAGTGATSHLRSRLPSCSRRVSFLRYPKKGQCAQGLYDSFAR